ncbi:mucin-17-like [Mercenaria mercenaria]|uniref:mucin-17-like n=1 Tax=Mercenaria mercenaria TaxID=6596 RepID=UPI00234E9EAA|nr:mucin-17-like [Mercenaria mercenaria]
MDQQLVEREACSKCHTSVEIETFDDIEPGDHISIRGEYFSKRKSRCIVKNLYTHHAIVNEVKQKTKDSRGAIAEVFHVMPPGKDKTKSIIVKEEIALNVQRDNIKKISYGNNVAKTKENILRSANTKFEDARQPSVPLKLSTSPTNDTCQPSVSTALPTSPADNDCPPSVSTALPISPTDDDCQPYVSTALSTSPTDDDCQPYVSTALSTSQTNDDCQPYVSTALSISQTNDDCQPSVSTALATSPTDDDCQPYMSTALSTSPTDDDCQPYVSTALSTSQTNDDCQPYVSTALSISQTNDDCQPSVSTALATSPTDDDCQPYMSTALPISPTDDDCQPYVSTASSTSQTYHNCQPSVPTALSTSMTKDACQTPLSTTLSTISIKENTQHTQPTKEDSNLNEATFDNYQTYGTESTQANKQVENAPSNEKYRTLFNNCEHFCHSCCTDERESFQVYRYCTCLRHCGESLLYSIPKLIRFLLKVLILTTDDFIRNVYIAGGILLFLLIIYLILLCLTFKQKLFCFCCTRGAYCRLKMPCCYGSCCKLTEKQAWYCKRCHKRNKRLGCIRFVIISFFQGIGFAGLVVMIYYELDPKIYGWIGLGFSVLTMLVYTFVPSCLLSRHCSDCPKFIFGKCCC